MYCHTLVSPGIGATLHTFLDRNVLMTDDLPTFGYPTKPTDIYCLSVLILASCRKSPRRDPLPNGLLMEAWKAMVGYSLDNTLSQRFVTHDGTCNNVMYGHVIPVRGHECIGCIISINMAQTNEIPRQCSSSPKISDGTDKLL